MDGKEARRDKRRKSYNAFCALCESRNVKPSVVMKELGYYPSVLTVWKQGESAPNVEKMVRISEYFGVNIRLLMGD